MPTTEQSLEALTDSALFERLAMSALRFLEPDFSLVISYGINAEGKTVVSPVDGVVRVPNYDPPRYALVEITTESLPKLRGKWLAQSGRALHDTDVDAGDLVKAARECKRIRAEYPAATFKVALVTNRQPSRELMDDVERYANAQRIIAVPVTRAPLAHFLDNKEDGNYLRERLFGVRQTRLSRELLHDIGTDLADLYAATFQIDDCKPWIREPYMDAVRAMIESRNQLTLLSGDSGRGKSSYSYRLLKDTLRSGGLALWCLAEDFASPQRWESSVLNAMRRVRQDIDERAGAQAFRMAYNEPLLIVVDDLNRLPEPTAVIERLIRQSRSDGSELTGNGERSLRSNVSMLVPILPKFTKRAEASQSKAFDPRIVIIPDMEIDAAAALIDVTRKAEPLRAAVPGNSRDVARSLARDPYLITTWARLRADRQNEPATSDVIEQFLDVRFEAIAFNNRLLGADVASAFQKLATAMLVEGRLDPTWDEVARWLADEAHRSALRLILREENVCKLERTAGVDRIVFQHDRLRDHILARALLSAKNSKVTDVVSDPFYAEIVATAATISEPVAGWAERLCEVNPLAAAIVLSDHHAIDDKRRAALAAALRDWWTKYPSNDDMHGNGDAARATIIQYWSTHTAALAAELLAKDISLSAFTAGARAGDLAKVLDLCRTSDIGMSDQWRDEAVLSGDRISGGRLLTEIEAVLLNNGIDDEMRTAALSAAGILGQAKLADACATAWSLSTNRSITLEAALFAIVRTSVDPNFRSTPALDYWASLDRTRDDHGASEYTRHTLTLPFALARIASEKLIPWLRYAHTTYPELRSTLFQVAERLRDPAAVRFTVELLEAAETVEGKQAAGFYRMMLRSMFDRPKLDAEALEELQRLWTDESLAATFRNQAFLMWADNATAADFELLARYDDSAIFGENVLAERVKLGDPATGHELAARIVVAEGTWQLSWIEYCASNWTERGVRAALYGSILARAVYYRDKVIGKRSIVHGSADEDLFISRVLRDLPAADVERILLSNWESLGYVDKYLAAALFVGTEPLQRAVHSILKQVENAGALFEALHGYFGFNEYGRRDLLSLPHVERLRPYFDHIPKNELGYIARWCNDHDCRVWRRSYLDPYLDDEQRRAIAPTESDLVQMLEQDISRQFGSHAAERWFRWSLRTSDLTDRDGMNLLARWYAQQLGDNAAFEACADILIAHGERRDLEWFARDLSADRMPLFEYTSYVVRRRSLS